LLARRRQVLLWFGAVVITAEELARALAGIVGEARVSTKPTDRTTYARDMWPRGLLAVRSGAVAESPPDAIVWPETAEEVAAIVQLARKLRVPIVPYGAGSGVCGGAVPILGGITIDTKRMDRVRAVDGEDLTVDAECGINGERLERELERRGYTLGHFPSSIYCSTLGGWLAARSGGQLSTKYGKIEDMVLGVTAVTGRGEVITTGRFGRSAAGPDFTQLLVGSEGTLAVLTSARLRIRPAPEVRHLRGYEFGSVLAGLEAIRRVLQRGLKPAVVRLYDEFDTMMALRQRHGSSKDRGGAGKGALPSLAGPSGADAQEGLWSGLVRLASGGGVGALRKDLLHAALDRPRIVNALADGLARKVGRRGCLLIVGVEGSAPRADVEANLVFTEMHRAGGHDLGDEPGRRWWANRYAVSYGMSKIFEAGAFVDTMEVASTWERLPDLYDGVRSAIARHAFVMAHFSHAYPEGCSIYFTFAAHASGRAAAERKYDAIWRDGLTAANRAGGTISHHHGVGLLKGPFMADEHREAMSIYHALKASFDPDGVLNPGKMGLSPAPGASWSQVTR
jgi:alkyldihydroxyacetonephosphate synthase